jgi:alpha-N-acetylglucosamine transferase
MKSKKQNEIYGSWIHNSFTKWNIFNPKHFPEIDKVILVDADMMFLQNCDELFELPAPALTFSSPWAKPYMTTKFGAYNPYGEMKHG